MISDLGLQQVTYGWTVGQLDGDIDIDMLIAVLLLSYSGICSLDSVHRQMIFR